MDKDERQRYSKSGNVNTSYERQRYERRELDRQIRRQNIREEQRREKRREQQRRKKRKKRMIRRIKRFINIGFILFTFVLAVICVINYFNEDDNSLKNTISNIGNKSDVKATGGEEEYEYELSASERIEFKKLYSSDEESKEYDGYVVCIDAGHGGTDVGAEGIDGSYEKDQALKLAYMVKSYLESAGIKVVMTRTKDVTLTLRERMDIAENCKADLLVSIHRNIYEGKEEINGIEAWINNARPESSMIIAEDILKEITNNVSGLNNRGVKWGTMDDVNDNYAINKVSMDSMILEIGFMTSNYDNNLFDSYTEKFAKGIAMGIMNQLQ